MTLHDLPDLHSVKTRSEAYLRRFVSIEELAAELGVSVRTIRRWQAAGRMPTRVKRGRRKAYLRSDMDAWKAQRGFSGLSGKVQT